MPGTQWRRLRPQLVGEDHLGAVVVEGRRVPEREVRVVLHPVDLLEQDRVRQVPDHAVTHAGTRRQLLRREDGDVVAARRRAGAIGVRQAVTRVAAVREERRLRYERRILGNAAVDLKDEILSCGGWQSATSALTS